MQNVPLGRLAKMFAWLGITSIGGGRSAYAYEVLVERRGWLSREEFLPGLALSQLLPGPTISNLCVFLGYSFRGAVGAALGLLGVLLPGALAILVLSAIYFNVGVGPAVNSALRGMGGAVAGFLCVTMTRIARGAFRSRGAVPIAGLTFVAVGLLRMNAFLVILLVGLLSIWLNRPGTGPAPAPAVPEKAE